MAKKLLEHSATELLKEFGAGNPTPGSGSAAALQGMLAANLLITVIKLTTKKGGNGYESIRQGFLEFEKEIEAQILPQLEELLEDDTYLFDKNIDTRKKRDREIYPVLKSELKRNVQELTKLSTEIPLKIALLCLRLIEIGEVVFDKGYRAVRGDSFVAFDGVISATKSCIAIIYLNLQQFGAPDYDWTTTIKSKLSDLSKRLQPYYRKSDDNLLSLKHEGNKNADLYQEIHALTSFAKSKEVLSDSEIEDIATQVQRLVWNYSERIWGKNFDAKDALSVLNPEKIFREILSYDFLTIEEIGISKVDGVMSEVAGYIDQDTHLVLISGNQSQPVRNFTAAHELGHAILHKDLVMHRDKPIDGSSPKMPRAPIERQADKFASYFLMPRKQVTRIFNELFLTNELTLNEETAFNLIQRPASHLRKECKNIHEFAKKIATAKSYAGANFNSLSEVFKVSPGAMAIRLEELGLVEF